MKTKLNCDQCEVLNINGLNCHEGGCPNKPIGKCSHCNEEITLGNRTGVCFANDWDGIPYCYDCACSISESEAREESEV